MRIVILTLTIALVFGTFCLKNSAQSIEAPTGDVSSISTEITPSGHSIEGLARSKANQAKIQIEQNWKATDYFQGDIPGKTYTVQLGDTLWEISEAHYGGGDFWAKILNKNLNLVGFLPDGTQALIFPGMILNL